MCTTFALLLIKNEKKIVKFMSKVFVNSSVFSSAIAKAASALPSNAIIPILECVKIEVKDYNSNVMTISGTDLEMHVEVEIECECDSDFSVCIQSRKLVNVIKTVSSQTVIITISNTDATIKTENGSYKFPIENGIDYPSVDDIEFDGDITIQQSKLSDAIRSTINSTANETILTPFNGVLFQVNSNGVKLTSTDRFVLSSYNIDSNNNISEYDIVIPKKVLQFMRSIPNSNSNVIISKSTTMVRFSMDNLICYSKLVDAKYPDISLIIPKDPPIKVAVNMGILLSAIDRVSSMCDMTGVITFKFGRDSGIELYASDTMYGNEASENIEAISYRGDDLNISFLKDFAIKILSIYKGKDVILGLTSNKTAMTVSLVDENYSLSLLMPSTDAVKN